MRVAIGGFIHESNSFSKEYTNLNMFKNWIYNDKDHLIDAHRNNHRILGGYVDYAEKKGWEILPLLAATALPAGPVKKEVYEHIKSKMTNNLRDSQVDGVLLHLHGAAVAEGYTDCEGDLLTEMRDAVGGQVPIMLVLDLHANISDRMVEKVDAIFGYNHQPHIDMYEREEEAAALFEKIKAGKVIPKMVRMQPPILLPAIATDTDKGPMKKMMEKAFTLEKINGVINVSPFAGFYGSNKREAGASVIVVTDSDKKQAEDLAEQMVDLFWEIKDEFFVPAVPVKEAAERAKREGGLWAFIDEADDPLGGGPADGTYILQELIDSGITSAGISTIHDPKAVERAYEAGVGGTVTGQLGAWKDDAHGSPVELHAKVVRLTHKKIPVAYWDDKDLQDPGRIALLDQNGILIVVTEHKTATENINIFSYLDIAVEQFNVMVLKGLGHAYQNVFKKLPKEYVTIDSIGVTNPDVTKLGEFKNIRRPIYPIDEDTVFAYR